MSWSNLSSALWAVVFANLDLSQEKLRLQLVNHACRDALADPTAYNFSPFRISGASSQALINDTKNVPWKGQKVPSIVLRCLPSVRMEAFYDLEDAETPCLPSVRRLWFDQTDQCYEQTFRSYLLPNLTRLNLRLLFDDAPAGLQEVLTDIGLLLRLEQFDLHLYYTTVETLDFRGADQCRLHVHTYLTVIKAMSANAAQHLTGYTNMYDIEHESELDSLIDRGGL